MLRWIVNFVVTSNFRAVQNRAVGHITVVELKLNQVIPNCQNHDGEGLLYLILNAERLIKTSRSEPFKNQNPE
jgi:hypothetical protein